MEKLVFIFWAVLLMVSPATGTSTRLLFVTLENPPDGYLKDGRPVGRNIDIVKTACLRQGYKCTIRIVPWKRALHMVKNGSAHGIIDAAFNEERAQFLYYPDEPIHIERWYAFKKKGTPLSLDKNLANADQIHLGTSRGFEYGGMLQEMIDNNRFKSIDQAAGNASNIRKLMGGRFDMFIGVKSTILSLARTLDCLDKIEIVKMTGTNEAYLLSTSSTYLAFSKKRTSPEIARQFSDVLIQMKLGGTVKQIERKYRSME